MARPMVLDMVTQHHENATAKDRLTENGQNAQQGQTKNAGGKEDPMSHRIIEKRRRDRMNNCLADLSRLIPAGYMKKGRGRVEKTEIIEMAIKHMKYLQSNALSSVEFQQRETMQSDRIENEKTHESAEKSILIAKQYKMGFFECLTETMQYLVEGHGYPPGHGLCLSLINHLRNHCAQIIKGKQVVPEVVKDEFIHEEPKSNVNVLMNLDEECDPNYEETNQKKSVSKNSRSNSSSSTSNEQALTDRCSVSFSTDSSSGSMYKFKTDIKQRFSAENSGAELTEYYGSTPDKKRCRFGSSSDSADDRQEVPIFALHANGSYYIPLTVSRDVISPMLDNGLTESQSSAVIVHPISISVNFQANANQL